ncbi:hypothetical protein L249_8241 [Ophiocordyceps polyrhachis-furcata BCC 54312]|uniref:Uncharacterized protein n=1 Tax=Ophiocordyceps polyrhachis-furcata BCC 54312 TaxID=1330021 RepID=A0A367LHB1_9HYPO|nr:hypothetical protein L249_8241 [Ophiocordyceps polyrhachis-furcata BCC 54312]
MYPSHASLLHGYLEGGQDREGTYRCNVPWRVHTSVTTAAHESYTITYILVQLDATDIPLHQRDEAAPLRIEEDDDGGDVFYFIRLHVNCEEAKASPQFELVTQGMSRAMEMSVLRLSLDALHISLLPGFYQYRTYMSINRPGAKLVGARITRYTPILGGGWALEPVQYTYIHAYCKHGILVDRDSRRFFFFFFVFSFSYKGDLVLHTPRPRVTRRLTVVVTRGEGGWRFPTGDTNGTKEEEKEEEEEKK